MANYSHLSRREQVLQKLIDANGAWVNGPDLANEEVGGSEGLKRLRELKQPEFGGYDIRLRKHPDPSRDIWQYRIVRREVPFIVTNLGMGSGDGEADTIADRRTFQSTISEQIHEQRQAAPEPAETYEYKQEPKGHSRSHLGKTEDGKYVLVRDDPPLPGQMEAFTDVDVTAQKFKVMPSALELGSTVPCPRCHGYRRAIRERDPITNKQIKGGRIIGYEELSRDPHKPSETCPRCDGFGVVPR